MPNYINGSSINSSEIEMYLAMSDSTSVIIDMNCCTIFSVFNMGQDTNIVYWDRIGMKAGTPFLSKLLPKVLLLSCGSISIVPCLDTRCKAASISQGTYHYIVQLADEMAKDVSQYVKQSIINTMDCDSTPTDHPLLPSPNSPSITLYQSSLNLYNVVPRCC